MSEIPLQSTTSHPLAFALATGVPRLQENALPWDPTVGLCLGPYAGPRCGAFDYERGTPERLLLQLPFHLST